MARVRGGGGAVIPVALLRARPEGGDDDPQVIAWQERFAAAYVAAEAAGVDHLTLLRLQRERRPRAHRGGQGGGLDKPGWVPLGAYDLEELRRFTFVDEAGRVVRF